MNSDNSDQDPKRSFFRSEKVFWLVTFVVAILIVLVLVRRLY